MTSAPHVQGWATSTVTGTWNHSQTPWVVDHRDFKKRAKVRLTCGNCGAWQTWHGPIEGANEAAAVLRLVVCHCKRPTV